MLPSFSPTVRAGDFGKVTIVSGPCPSYFINDKKEARGFLGFFGNVKTDHKMKNDLLGVSYR